MSDLRRDPLSGRLTVVAPARAVRPGTPKRAVAPADQQELVDCPFCAGREDRTPPETLRIGDPWRIRIVPNLYPAANRQEVVVHSPWHARSLTNLDAEELGLVTEAWQRRARDIPGPYLHAFVNEGPEAGASLAHSHSQLVWLSEPPPAVRKELEASSSECVLCRPPDESLVIGWQDGVVLSATWAGRLPYELLAAPIEHEDDPWTSPRLATALALAVAGLRRLHAIEGSVPVNLWLHAAGHWHLELVPRLAVLGGLELGAGIFVNTLDPAEAAGRLQAVES